MSKDLSIVILAAGKGKRMRSATPKVLHTLFNKPMLHYVIEATRSLKPKRTVVVVGKDHALIKESLKGCKDTQLATQHRQLGTADALASAKAALGRYWNTVLVLCGDTPLIRPSTLKRLLTLHNKHRNDLSFVSFTAAHPHAYGSVVRNDKRKPVSIVEASERGDFSSGTDEVNSGVYIIGPKALSLLPDIPMNSRKGEYYLTDLVSLCSKQNMRIEAYDIGGENEFMGVNNRLELTAARKSLASQIIDDWSFKGVDFYDASNAYVHPDVKIGKATCIYPNVFISGNSSIGKNCTIYPGVRIHDSEIGDNSIIKDHTIIDSSIVGRSTQIGPFAHIRPGSTIKDNAKIGNFVEVKKSSIGNGTKAMHLSYIGDAVIGKNVNIGAGTITCNYDGVSKHATVIEDNVFVGSDSQFVAPVCVGKAAYVGAGSTVTKDVPPGSLAISRTPQKNISGWKPRSKGSSRKTGKKKGNR